MSYERREQALDNLCSCGCITDQQYRNLMLERAQEQQKAAIQAQIEQANHNRQLYEQALSSRRVAGEQIMAQASLAGAVRLPKPELRLEIASDAIEYRFRFGNEHAVILVDGKLLRYVGDRAKAACDAMACEFAELLKKFRQPPDLGALAYAVFCSDPDVIAFAKSKSENFGDHGGEKYEHALRVAWERDENGWTARAQRRAWVLYERLFEETK